MMESGFSLFPERASTFAGRVDALYYFLTAVSVFFTILIAGLVIYFAVKYRRRSDSEYPEPIAGSVLMELTWVIVPLGIAMIMFFWGASVYFSLSRPPKDALEVYGIGKQWMWKFQHPEGQREINELHVPVGRAIRLIMTSQDVIHSFYVPAFRVKADVLPGRYITTWFEATKPGQYHLFCAEYCGTQHSGMIGRVVVMEPVQYQAWLSGTTEESVASVGAPGAAAQELPSPAEEGGVPEGSLAAEGQKLFQDLGCSTCHKVGSQGRGPVLTGLYGKQVQLQGGGTVVADENYLRESILNPGAKVVAGFRPIMPPFEGRISEEELLKLISYIKSLGTQEAPAPPGAPPPSGAKPELQR